MELIPGTIPAPQVQQRRKASLLTSAIPGPDLGGVDWHKGVIAWPESAPSYRVVQDCTEEIADYLDDEYGPVGARPFVIQTVTHCPRGNITAMADRAERHIRNITSQALAYELWTGDATALDPWTLPTGQVALANQRPGAGTADEGPYLNPHFAATASALSVSLGDDATSALGAVEAAVAEKLAGGPIYLHIPTEFVTSMGSDLSSEGDLIRTPTGGIVIADAGYPGKAADADPTDFTVYGSGPITVWLDEPVVYDQDSWVVDHNTNRVAVWAERTALIWFDPQTLVGCTVSTA